MMETFDPEVSIASTPISLKTLLIIDPLEKSESIQSDKVFLISKFLILNLDSIRFIASSHLLSNIFVDVISTSYL